VPLIDAVANSDLIHNASYEDHWGLRLRPFENVPDPNFYVPSAKHEAAMQRILYGIAARKGIVMWTGEIGRRPSASMRLAP
jgi:general secretion pathway protein A